MSARPACLGLSDLFDATDSRSHNAARIICSTCPAIVDCRIRLRQAKAKATGVKGGGPEGTWAGVLHKPQGATT